MLPQEVTNLLDAHARSIIWDEKMPASLRMDAYALPLEIKQLLSMAVLLKEALVPVVPPPTMIRRIKQALLADEALALPPRRRNGLLISAAALGSLLSVAGIAIWALRRFRSIPHTQIAS